MFKIFFFFFYLSRAPLVRALEMRKLHRDWLWSSTTDVIRTKYAFRVFAIVERCKKRRHLLFPRMVIHRAAETGKRRWGRYFYDDPRMKNCRTYAMQCASAIYERVITLLPYKIAGRSAFTMYLNKQFRESQSGRAEWKKSPRSVAIWIAGLRSSWKIRLRKRWRETKTRLSFNHNDV